MRERSAGELTANARLFGLLALIAVVHLPLLRYGLIYDDGWTLRSNGFLRPGEFELGLLFSPEAAARHVPDAFRPTLVAFDALSLRLLALDSAAHHALSIVLHLGVCLTLERILAYLEVDEALRLASVACFGLLAIHVEAIAVVSFREDLLAALLGLAAVLAALHAGAPERAAAGRWALAGAAMVLSALACGAKLSAAPLSAVVLVLAWLAPNEGARTWARGPGSRARVTLAVVALGLGVVLALVQTWLVYRGTPYGADNPRILASRVGLGPVLAASTQIHLGYLQQIAVPLGLSPEYVDRGARWLAPATVASVALLLGLTIAAIAGRRRWPLGSFAYLAWLLLCLPTSNLVGLPNMRADRFMYLASAPLCVAIAAGLLGFGRVLAERLPALAPDLGEGDTDDEPTIDPRPWLPLAAFVILQGSFTLAEGRVYVSNTTLWHEAAERAPDSARAHALLGLERVALAQRSERLSPELMAAAEVSCERAEHLDPRYELPQLCLGALAIAREDWPTAYARHARAVELSIDRNDRPIAALAQIALDLPSEWYAQRGAAGERAPGRSDRVALSRSWLDRGLHAYPYSPELHAAAARVYHRLGDGERALEALRRARSLRPDRWETVVQGVELALDLGDAAAAHRTWWAEAELLAHADPATRTRLRRRLAAARRDPDFSLLHSLLSPGVFPP